MKILEQQQTIYPSPECSQLIDWLIEHFKGEPSVNQIHEIAILALIDSVMDGKITSEQNNKLKAILANLKRPTK